MCGFDADKGQQHNTFDIDITNLNNIYNLDNFKQILLSKEYLLPT